MMENCPKGLNYAFSGCKKIHPCVLQDIGLLGPLACSHTTTLYIITLSRALGTADHLRSLDDLF